MHGCWLFKKSSDTLLQKWLDTILIQLLNKITKANFFFSFLSLDSRKALPHCSKKSIAVPNLQPPSWANPAKRVQQLPSNSYNWLQQDQLEVRALSLSQLLVSHEFQFCTVGNALGWFCLSQLGHATGIWWGKDRSAAKHPAMRRSVPRSKVIQLQIQYCITRETLLQPTQWKTDWSGWSSCLPLEWHKRIHQ